MTTLRSRDIRPRPEGGIIMKTRTIIGRQQPARKIKRRFVAASVGLATVLAAGLFAGPGPAEAAAPVRR